MDELSEKTFSFGDFELSGTKRSLLKQGASVALSPKIFDLLLVLVENHGQILTKDELLEKVWEGQFVEENNLTVQIAALRKLLGEKKGEHQFIATIPGKGYKFIGELNDTAKGEIIIENHKIERITIDKEIDEGKPETLKLTSGKTSHRKTFVALLGLILLISVVGFLAFRYFKSTPVSQINSLAVLPFVNQNGDANNEYLSDGLAESVIFSLSQSPNLRVMSHSSVFRYKGKETDAKTIGAELNVQAVLTGRIYQNGDNLNVSTELVSTSDNSVIWGEQFSRKISDLEKLQTDIAGSIANKLRLKIAGIKTRGTDSAEAYKLYLKGRYQWNKRSPESLKQAVELYKQAIEIDPNYALAFSGLAETYSIFSGYNIASPNDSMPQAKAAALKALELDDSLAEAHTALAHYLNSYEWNRTGAEQEYRRAIELNPNYATAHHWFGDDYLVQMKRFDEALTELRRAEELDPLSPAIRTDLGSLFFAMRRYDEAISQYNSVLALEPNFIVARANLSQVFYRKGMYRESIAEIMKSPELSADALGKGFLALALAKSGQRAEAVRLLGEIKLEAAQKYVPSYAFAMIYIGLNDKDEALFWLEKEMDERGYWANLYAIEPELDELRGEPRFKAMLKRMNLPE